jgi:glycerophosphoryl diester phosphodiesterase
MPEMLAAAAKDLKFAWRSLALTDIAYKAVAFALLSPLTALVLHWLITRRRGPAVADVDILWFFVTTRSGILVLVIGGALLAGITALGTACLMAIGISASAGRHMAPRHALLFGASRAQRVLALTAHMVVRVLAGLIPFGAVAGITYATLLRSRDINYYLADRPPAFWAAAAVVGLMAAGLIALILRTLARWALALPLVLFEDVPPRRALGEAARLAAGHRRVILGAIAGWGVFAVALLALASWLPEAIGRAVAPQLPESFAALSAFIVVLAVTWAALGVLAGVVNASLFAVVIVRLYLMTRGPGSMRLPEAATLERQVAHRLRRPILAGVVTLFVLAVTGTTALAIVGSKGDQPVLVIAHRGASSAAPENTLSAFRIAGDEKTDVVELDVQESSDGEVVVVHDSDLMRVGRSPLKIWGAPAAALQAVRIEPGERVPTLAEALAACKGRCRVLVELKSYGHDQQLEDRVVAIVEAAGMAEQCIFMSLDHGMMRKLKELRPSWTCGILVAKAMGDLTALPADFLAVESKIATRRFVRQAHRVSKPVYVWTVNDPGAMLGAMSRGVDGLITDKPGLARSVVGQRAAMSDAQRVLVALLIRLKVSPETPAIND